MELKRPAFSLFQTVNIPLHGGIFFLLVCSPLLSLAGRSPAFKEITFCSDKIGMIPSIKIPIHTQRSCPNIIIFFAAFPSIGCGSNVSALPPAYHFACNALPTAETTVSSIAYHNFIYKFIYHHHLVSFLNYAFMYYFTKIITSFPIDVLLYYT